MNDKFLKIIYGTTALFGALAAAKFAGRRFIDRTADKYIKKIMTDEYHENLWEFISASSRVGPQEIVELNLRAEYGQALERPLGSPKKFPSLDQLMFSYAQINTMPIPEDVPINTAVTIGKKARKPLQIDTPIMIGGMAYGFALSEQFRMALAKGSAQAGTALSSGQSGFLPRELKAAGKCILQYTRGTWSKSPGDLRAADAIELHVGQGAVGGLHSFIKANEVDSVMRKQFGGKKGQDVIYHSRIPAINTPKDLIKTVTELRRITDGIPIGVKIGAGDELERDLYWCLEADVDFVAVDGAEAASKGSPPLLLDHFGLPTVYALSRAVNYLKKEGAFGEVDLIGSGKLINPGDFMKALALGCSAVYIGTAALFATAHTEVLKSLPLEPPTQVAWRGGKDATRFDPDKGAKNLANYIKSCTEEMKLGLSVLGKTSVAQLSKTDLVAIDPLIAEITGIRPAHVPPPAAK